MIKKINGIKGNSIKTYRQMLLNKKEELSTALGINFKRLADSERNSTDDLTVALQNELLQLGLDRVLYGQLHEVQSALDRLGSGDYGICANCATSISTKRLQAIPWATYCLECQDRVFIEQVQEAVPMEAGFSA